MSDPKRLGFFSRLLDDAPPAERYRLATAQIQHAETLGFDTAWVAQHHFNHNEGGLPSPFVFLTHVAAHTSSIRLGTGIVTLPLEAPLRVAEDAAVFDLLSNGRLELGLGSGGTPSSFAAFGLDSAQRGPTYGANLSILRDAFASADVGGGNQLYPQAKSLLGRIWQATFSVDGGRRAGLAGDGLMLSRTQPRSADRPDASLADLQQPIIDAYLQALPPGATPRILASRSLFAADDSATALQWAEIGLRRNAEPSAALEDLIRTNDTHVGSVQDVIDSLAKDATLGRATDISFQVHSVDPPHALILRSLELVATAIAPALGWRSPPFVPHIAVSR